MLRPDLEYVLLSDRWYIAISMSPFLHDEEEEKFYLYLGQQNLDEYDIAVKISFHVNRF